MKGVLFDSIEGFFIKVSTKTKGGEIRFDVGRKSSTQVGKSWQIKHTKVPSHGGKDLFYFCFMKVVFFSYHCLLCKCF